MPIAASDIGVIPCLSPTDVLLVGGFGAEGRSIKQVLKFSARLAGSSGSQDQLEHCLEELDAGDMKADFFSTNSVVTDDTAECDSVTIFGAQYKHTFAGMAFTKSQMF